MNNVKFSCLVDTNDQTNTIGLDIFLNNDKQFSENITGEKVISFNIPNENKEWTITFKIYGKNSSHTTLDNNGNIIKSTELSITNISFDEFDISNIIAIRPLTYLHNFNGNGEEINDKFFGIAGCNGTIELNFRTPIHIWLLENM